VKDGVGLIAQRTKRGDGGFEPMGPLPSEDRVGQMLNQNTTAGHAQGFVKATKCHEIDIGGAGTIDNEGRADSLPPDVTKYVAKHDLRRVKDVH
jgi:hypothetical protein